MTNLKLPLIVIMGPTASGKSRIAIELAEQYNGEIIAADSRTIYKGMNIGTAKPSKADQARVPHWGLDLVSPNELFSAANFKAYALEKIKEIRARGHVPFLVGGTGLYVDSVVFDYEFGPAVNSEKRMKLERMSLKELYNYCIQYNITLPENTQNKRYIIRAIEQKGINTKRLLTPIDNTIIVGITTNREQLREQIHLRSEQLFDDGVVDEAKRLGDTYGWEGEAMTGNIYRLARQYANDEITEYELKIKNEQADWQLAKRQLTWMKRNRFITWLPFEEVHDYIAGSLA